MYRTTHLRDMQKQPNTQEADSAKKQEPMATAQNRNWLKSTFIWLSGAGEDSLEKCPHWEQRKYVAFGAAVLVPTVFALISASYAVSTLTPNPWIIVPIAIVWAFIILTIDRALLATYRSFQTWKIKATQFSLRLGVAVLMGLTISHPLTLLLFKDTITAQIESDRDAEIASVRTNFSQTKSEVERRLHSVENTIAENRREWKGTFEAQFITEAPNATKQSLTSHLDVATKKAMRAEVADAIEGDSVRITEIDAQMAQLAEEYRTLQGEIDHWQREFEKEIDGQRSGVAGVGPRARSIRDDQLAWRRTESQRMSGLMQTLTAQRGQLQSTIDSTKHDIQAQFAEAAANRAAKAEAERKRVATLRNQVQEQQAAIFVDQQSGVRNQIQAQIDAGLMELNRLQTEVSKLSTDEQERVAALREQPRRDLLTKPWPCMGCSSMVKTGDTSRSWHTWSSRPCSCWSIRFRSSSNRSPNLVLTM